MLRLCAYETHDLICFCKRNNSERISATIRTLNLTHTLLLVLIILTVRRVV